MSGFDALVEDQIDRSQQHMDAAQFFLSMKEKIGAAGGMLTKEQQERMARGAAKKKALTGSMRGPAAGSTGQRPLPRGRFSGKTVSETPPAIKRLAPTAEQMIAAARRRRVKTVTASAEKTAGLFDALAIGGAKAGIGARGVIEGMSRPRPNLLRRIIRWGRGKPQDPLGDAAMAAGGPRSGGFDLGRGLTSWLGGDVPVRRLSKSLSADVPLHKRIAEWFGGEPVARSFTPGSVLSGLGREGLVTPRGVVGSVRKVQAAKAAEKAELARRRKMLALGGLGTGLGFGLLSGRKSPNTIIVPGGGDTAIG